MNMNPYRDHSQQAPAETPMLASFNPANGEGIGEVIIDDAISIASKVAIARTAQPAWRGLSAQARAEIIEPLGEQLVARSEELGLLLSQEMGKPLQEAIGEVKHCGESLEKELNGIVDALAPEILDDGSTATHCYFDPLGVCAAITPWNFPLAMPHWLVIPALMAGNAVVLKPSEETPLIAQAYADLLLELLPRGVLQVVHGADDQGALLVSSNVDLVAFTGSREVGSKILSSVAPDLKRVVLELGGKDPMVVLNDADVDSAARFAVRNSFRNAGQVCVSTERIYVDEQIAEDFKRRVADLTGDLAVGPGEDNPDVGPMISTRQRDHVLAQLEQARLDGAQVLAGGTGHHGNFVMPTVLDQLDHDMAIMRDETFGPVACIMSFKDEAEAARLANDTPYGLGAVVFGADLDRAAHFARKLEAGMIGINQGCGGASGSPWVGAKQSGYGFHSSKDGHRQFCQRRLVSHPRKRGAEGSAL